ncbi:MAG: uracil-xanthine permease family protein [Actinomycetota bacterium]
MSSPVPGRTPATRLGLGWHLHGDGRTVTAGEVVRPRERLTWPRTAAIGAQHVVAMFGATFLVPLITGFPPSTTLFFSGVGTILFLVLTAGRVPSYLGSSFAFIAPITASVTQYGPGGALGGVLMAGVALFLIGLVVQFAGTAWLQRLMPPLVTGTIVALIGFNLAPSAKENFMAAPVTALVTLASIVLVSVLFRGLPGRLSILLGVLAGYLTAVLRGDWVAAVVAILLSVFPVFGAAVSTVPAGVLGGAATVLYGMIGMLGVRIWVQNRVDFSNPVNLTTAAVAMIVGIADYTWEVSGLQFAGIALGTGATLVVYHVMAALARVRGTVGSDPLAPDTARLPSPLG